MKVCRKCGDILPDHETSDRCPVCNELYPIDKPPPPAAKEEIIEEIKEKPEDDLKSPESEKNINLVQCEDCGKEISKNADTCPHCGSPNFRRKDKEIKEKITKVENIAIEIIVLIFIIAIIAKIYDWIF